MGPTAKSSTSTLIAAFDGEPEASEPALSRQNQASRLVTLCREFNRQRVREVHRANSALRFTSIETTAGSTRAMMSANGLGVAAAEA
jgi:hypothetical protein